MNHEVPQSIINKLQKIMNLADPSRNPSPNEVENAMRAAKRLMAEHNLSMADIPKAESTKKHQEVKECEGYYGVIRKWEYTLFHAINELCMVKHFVITHGSYCKRKIIFVGTEANTQMAIQIHRILLRMVKQYAKEFAGSALNHGPYNSYAYGFVTRLWQRAKDEKVFDDQEKQGKYALMVVDNKQALTDYMDNKNLKKNRKATKLSKNFDLGAYQKGNLDAVNVNLDFKGAIQ